MRIVLMILTFLPAVVMVVSVSTLIDGRLSTLETMIVGGVTFIFLNAFLDRVKTTLYPEKTNDKNS